jgi:hypothetical protein
MHGPDRKIGLWYGAGSLALAALAVGTAPWGLVIAWPAASLVVVSTGYLGLGPGVFGKREGRLHPLARALHAPYLLALSIWHPWRAEGAPDDLVCPRLRLGRRASRRRAAALVEQGVTAVLDLTCEYDEVVPFRAVGYHNAQVLDLTPPPLERLAEAVAFVLDRMGSGEVYVHCAQGSGRSAIVAAACLLALDEALGVDDACARVEAARPTVRLRSAAAQRVLEEYERRCRAGRSD